MDDFGFDPNDMNNRKGGLGDFDLNDPLQWMIYGAEEEEELLRGGGNTNPPPNGGCASTLLILFIALLVIIDIFAFLFFLFVSDNVVLAIVTVVIGIALIGAVMKM